MTKNIFILLLLALLSTTLLSCSSMKIQDFENNTPKISFSDFFAGKVEGSGYFFDRFGNMAVSFTATLNGTWNESTNSLDLVEDFQYSTGEKIKRIYNFKKEPSGIFRGTAEGFVGDIIVETKGNALHWTYKLNQYIKGSIWTLGFSDWMWLQPDGKTILNRAFASKWGIKVGDVFTVLMKK